MNVALVIESLEFGGSETVVQRLATGLSAAGHRACIYCLQHAAVPTTELAHAGVLVREARAFGPAPWLPLTLARWLKMDQIAVVHAHSCAGFVWALPAAGALRLPLLHVWHGWPPGRPGRYPWLAAQLARCATQIGVNSRALLQRLPQTRPFRAATYLPNGLDLPQVPRAAARAALEKLCQCALPGPVVLSVGNIRWEKDQRTLLAALARLRQVHPSVHLVCVGLHQEPDYWRAVSGDCDRLGLRACAHFPGGVADAWRLMAGADVLCLSSLSESLPNVVLEAMSQHTPVVATAVGDVGRLNDNIGPVLLKHGETGLVVPPRTPRALADALAESLGNPAAAVARASRAYAHYRAHFSTARMVSRYVAAYTALCAGRPQAPAIVPAPTQRCRRAALPRVLMLGPHPSDLGGMVTAIDLLMTSSLRARFHLTRFATTEPRRTPARRCGGLERWARTCTAGARHAARLIQLGATLAARRIDLVHVHTCSHFTFYRNLLDIAVARLFRRPVLLHVRGGQFAEFCRSATVWQQRWIRAGFAAAAGAIVLSPRWRRELREWTGACPVHVIPNAVRIARSAAAPGQQPSDGPCRFLYLALLTRAKGLEDLLSAAVLLKRNGVPFELVLAGPSPEQPLRYWLARVHDLGLADRVRFTGAVRGAAKDQLFATADCFVHPSHSEALPNAVLEAAAAGLPVVATSVGSLPEVFSTELGPVAPLVPPHDVAALATEMARMALDEPWRRGTGIRLRAHVARTSSLSRVAARIARVYAGILAGRTPTGPAAGRNNGARDATQRGGRNTRAVAGPVAEYVRTGHGGSGE